MPSAPADYQRLVLDEVHSYKGLAHPVQANLFERLFTRKLPTEALHPNPDDEFTHEEIGPCAEKMSQYVDEWGRTLSNHVKPDIEPLSVEKTSIGGYMLLDGHHRWFAACKLRIPALPVRVMNVTPIA